jgi:hypothetical protein
MTKQVIFTGCSFTAGTGWVKGDPDTVRSISYHKYPGLWVNACHYQIPQLKKLSLVNMSRGGSSNEEIFGQTIQAISNYATDIDTLFCQWTSMPRYTFDIGFELWDTSVSLQSSMRGKTDINVVDDTWSSVYINDLLDRLLVLHHLHREIVKLVHYTTLLQNLAQRFDIKLYFINGLCPWDQDYFVNLCDNNQSDITTDQFTSFTKKTILQSDLRSNEDNLKLYKKIHEQYKAAGGINPSQWVNLYDSMLDNKIDVNYDNRHPGTKSNQLYVQQIKNFLKTQ